jgi:hypothetical protein
MKYLEFQSVYMCLCVCVRACVCACVCVCMCVCLIRVYIFAYFINYILLTQYISIKFGVGESTESCKFNLIFVHIHQI